MSFICHFVLTLLVHLQVSFEADLRPFSKCGGEVEVRALNLALEDRSKGN